MGAEQELYKKLKTSTPKIIWNRVENLSVVGMPDLLGYNANGHFFTVELKVTKGKKIKFSPHQIAFHVTHPKNSLSWSRPLIKGPGFVFNCILVQGSWHFKHPAGILSHSAWALKLAGIFFTRLELAAWCLELGAWHLPAGVLGAWSLRLAWSLALVTVSHGIACVIFCNSLDV